jgi:predicted DCC family thiol-disulfide oxidoreductase YuxK
MAGPFLVFEEEQNYLLFDGECGLCHAAARLAERIDRGPRFRILPYQQVPEEELQRRGASHEKCSRRVHVLSARGKIYTGAFAVNYFLRQYFPWKILVALIYAVPVLLLFEIIGYALVARHRRRLSQWLGFNACVLPASATITSTGSKPSDS